MTEVINRLVGYAFGLITMYIIMRVTEREGRVMDRREYVCNQMYKQHDLLRKGSWTDADKLEYMELNIAPYSRYWRMGMKKALKHAIRLLREE